MTLRDGIKKMRASEKESSSSEHSRKGTVKSMGSRYSGDGDDETCEMCIEHEAPKAGKGDNPTAIDAPERLTTIRIPKGHSGRFAIGDKVKVTTRVDPVTKGAD